MPAENLFTTPGPETNPIDQMYAEHTQNKAAEVGPISPERVLAIVRHIGPAVIELRARQLQRDPSDAEAA